MSLIDFKKNNIAYVLKYREAVKYLSLLYFEDTSVEIGRPLVSLT